MKSENNGGVSVIICTYNSESRIEKTLYYLSKQEATVEWELILVDNNSKDNTAEIVNKIWSNLSNLAEIRVVKELTQGLIFARKTGVQWAKYNIIVFCDDDNWLGPNYIQLAYDIMTSNDNAGVAGGIGIPVFETKEPPWFKTYKNAYAVGRQFKEEGDITKTKGYVYGAGMVLNKKIYKRFLNSGFKSKTTGRVKNKLSSGEDSEICYRVAKLGYKIWYDERLMFYHYIPKERLTWEYLVKNFESFGESYAILWPMNYEVLNGRKIKKSQIFKELINRTIRHLIPFIEYCLFPFRLKKTIVKGSWFKGYVIGSIKCIMISQKKNEL